MRKLSNTEADLKKSAAYKKSVYFKFPLTDAGMNVFDFLIIVITARSIV